MRYYRLAVWWIPGLALLAFGVVQLAHGDNYGWILVGFASFPLVLGVFRYRASVPSLEGNKEEGRGRRMRLAVLAAVIVQALLAVAIAAGVSYDLQAPLPLMLLHVATFCAAAGFLCLSTGTALVFLGLGRNGDSGGHSAGLDLANSSGDISGAAPGRRTAAILLLTIPVQLLVGVALGVLYAPEAPPESMVIHVISACAIVGFLGMMVGVAALIVVLARSQGNSSPSE